MNPFLERSGSVNKSPDVRPPKTSMTDETDDLKKCLSMLFVSRSRVTSAIEKFVAQPTTSNASEAIFALIAERLGILSPPSPPFNPLESIHDNHVAEPSGFAAAGGSAPTLYHAPPKTTKTDTPETD